MDRRVRAADGVPGGDALLRGRQDAAAVRRSEKRLLLIALLIFFPATLAAQFSFYPSTGSPAGGDVIQFTASDATIDFRCAGCDTPQVLFGGTASPQVTVINSKSLKATTPAHAEGVVGVEVRVGGKSYTTFFNFGYARPRQETLIPVAIEILGGFGARWTTDIWVYNDTDEVVNLYPEVCSSFGAVFPCGEWKLIVDPRSLRRIPPRVARDGSYPAAYLYPPADVADRLYFSVRVRNASNPSDVGTEIPVVRTLQFRRGKVMLLNVPAGDRFRGLLRMYDQPYRLTDILTTRIYDSISGVLLAQHQTSMALPTDGPTLMSMQLSDFLNDAAVRGHDSVRVEIESQNSEALLWALLTLTDNETQRVVALTPQ